MSSKIVIVLILVLVFATRFFHLNWGGGYYFHPDENNMASAVSSLSLQNLNPHFFAYGQFPLYLAYFSQVALNRLATSTTAFSVSFSQAVGMLRFYSAVFSTLSLLFLYLTARLLFKGKTTPLIALLLAIFLPGLIQLAHFGTTESLLIFVFIGSIYMALRLSTRFSYRLLFIAALIGGIGLGSKITALTLITPVLLVLLFKPKALVVYSVLIFILFVLFSPYNLINFSDFLGSMRYETTVATGKLPVFYTQQFSSTQPYIFQLKSVFPYALGLPIFVISWVTCILVFTKTIKVKPSRQVLFTLFTPALLYFLYQGQLYVKWYRFMSPLFIVFPLLVAWSLSFIRHRYLRAALVLLCIFPGIYFFKIYLNPDVRLEANSWITKHIPIGSSVLTEGGNVIDLPISSSYNVQNFDFYSLSDNPEQLSKLTNAINTSDWIIVPSRRVFYNFTTPRYPQISNYYQHLFDGKLGFTQVAKFQQNTSWLLTSENAEETYTVFDHPTVRIFRKDNNLSPLEITTLLTP